MKKRYGALVACFVLLAVLITGCAGGGKSGGKVKVTFFIWAGSNQGVVPREVVEQYLADNPNVEIEFLESSNAETYPKMVAAKKATPDQPLVHFGFFNVSSLNLGVKDDLWESLNPDRIPNMKNTLATLQRDDNFGAPYQMSVMGLMYNTDEVKEPPTSWSALWDPAYRGKVVTFDYQWQALVLAARLNGGDEKNIDPGFQIWADNAQNLKALPTTNDALKNLMVSGDATIAPWFYSMAHLWAEEGAPLGYVTPDEGPLAFPLYLAISKGVTAEQRAVAEDIINMLLAPEAAGRYAELTYSIPAVTNAKVSEAVQNDPFFGPLLAEKAIQIDWETYAEQNSVWKERWDKEVKSKM